MPSFSKSLEQVLHKALSYANERRHEYATLEHLLLALVDDEHAGQVMSACGVDLGELKTTVAHYLDTELGALTEPLGVGCEAVLTGEVGLGDTVLVIVNRNGQELPFKVTLVERR